MRFRFVVEHEAPSLEEAQANVHQLFDYYEGYGEFYPGPIEVMEE